MTIRERSELLPAEQIAWDRCDAEHSWDDPCPDCKILIERINNLVKVEVIMAITARQDRIQLTLDRKIAELQSAVYGVMHYGE